MKVDKKQLLIFGIIGALILSIFMIVLQIKEPPHEIETTTTNDYRYITVNHQDYHFKTNMKSILFLGIDTKKQTEGQGQSDAIYLLLFDRDEKKIKVISLSRDIMCDIRLFDASGNDLGWQKQHLGLAYSYGNGKKHGSILCLNALSRLLYQIPLIDYVNFSLSDLTQIQDIVGDLGIVLKNDYSKINEDWKKGDTIIINQDNVESFLRNRDTSTDYSNNMRMERQQEYIENYIFKIKRMLKNDFDGTTNKLYSFYNRLTTNLTLDEVENDADMLLDYTFDQQDFYFLPGENIKGSLHDEYYVNDKELKQFVLNLFYEKD